MLDLVAIADAIARATPAGPADAALLAQAQELLSGEQTLGVSEVAKLLGVSSPATIHNWLERGYFPSAYRTVGGHRRFRLADILELQAHIAQTKAENASGHVEIPDYGDRDPYAERSAQRAALRTDRAEVLTLELAWLADWQVRQIKPDLERLYRMLGAASPAPVADPIVLRAALKRHLVDTLVSFPQADRNLAASDAYDAACDALGAALAADQAANMIQTQLGPQAPGPGDEAGCAYLVRLVALLSHSTDLNDQECLRSLRRQYSERPHLLADRVDLVARLRRQHSERPPARTASAPEELF